MNNILSKSIFLCLFLCTVQLAAQNALSGTVQSKSNEPISFANIVLLNAIDSAYIDGMVSDESGQFYWKDLPKGDFLLQVSYVGYKDKFVPIQLLEGNTLDIIYLTEVANDLETITVAAKRKLISKKIDRMVFDVQNSSKSSQGDALDVLGVTPGIRVRNETVNMIGKSGVSVMVNDKIIRLQGEELTSFLRTIASEDISKIEVITTPPAKYEAEGNSGLINIQTKEAKADSWKVSLRSDYRKRTKSRSFNGVNFLFNKNRLNLSLSTSYLTGVYTQNEENYAHFSDELWYTNSSFGRAFDDGNGRINLSYNLTSKWTIGGQYIFSSSIQETNYAPYTSIRDNDTNQLNQTLSSTGGSDQNQQIHSLNLYNQIDLDTFGRKVSINFDYFYFNDLEDKRYDGFSEIKSPYLKEFYQGVNSNNQVVNNASVAIDFELPTDFADLELGGKFTQTNSINDINFFNSGLIPNEIPNFQTENGNFKYKESIAAVYVSGQKDISKKFTMKMGLRMESTKSSSVSDDLDFDQQNNYWKLFPTIYASYKAKENTTYNLSYNRRISRAPFYMLTPNPWYSDPFQFVVGNPFIQPSFADNIEAGLTINNLSVNAYYNWEEDVFTQVPNPEKGSKVIEFKFQNFLDIKRTGVNANYVFEHFKWWSSNLNADFNHSINEYVNDGLIVKKKGYSSNFSTSNDFTLNKSKNILFNLSYWYSPKGVDEFWDIQSMSNLSASLQFLLLDKKLKFTLRANDIFRTQSDNIVADRDGVLQVLNLYYDARYFGAAAVYNFGGKNISSPKNKVGNQDERNRAGRF